MVKPYSLGYFMSLSWTRDIIFYIITTLSVSQTVENSNKN